jgi:hypothetical protein
MKEIVYIETTIVSYLVARPSRDLILSAHQQVNRDWWRDARESYACITSDEVMREAALGEPDMSRRRLEALNDITMVTTGEEAIRLAHGILEDGILPPSVFPDAVHVAVAAMNGASILLTWNCRHLANPHLLPRLRKYLERHGCILPEVCTPIELDGE